MSTWRNPGGAALVRGDACAIPLGDNTVDLIVTSPPYFALRSYQDGGEHYAGQIGSEATPAEFVDALIAATAEMVRVLKPSARSVYRTTTWLKVSGQVARFRAGAARASCTVNSGRVAGS